MKPRAPYATITVGLLVVVTTCILAYGMTMADVSEEQVVSPGVPWQHAIWIISATLPVLLWMTWRTRYSRTGARIAGWVLVAFGIFFGLFAWAEVFDRSPDQPAIQVVAACAAWLLSFGLAFLILGREIQIPPRPAPSILMHPEGGAAVRDKAPAELPEPSEATAVAPAPAAQPAAIRDVQPFLGRIVAFSIVALIAAGVSMIPAIPPAQKYIVLLCVLSLGLVSAGLVPAQVISDIAKVFSKQSQ